MIQTVYIHVGNSPFHFSRLLLWNIWPYIRKKKCWKPLVIKKGFMFNLGQFCDLANLKGSLWKWKKIKSLLAQVEMEHVQMYNTKVLVIKCIFCQNVQWHHPSVKWHKILPFGLGAQNFSSNETHWLFMAVGVNGLKCRSERVSNKMEVYTISTSN